MFLSKSFQICFTIFISIFVVLGIAESQEINFEPESAKPQIHGLNVNESFKMRKNIRTGKREWIDDNPTVGIGIYVDAYGIGKGQGTLTNITILGKSYPKHQDEAITVGEMFDDGGWDKGTGSTQVYATIHESFDTTVPIHKVQDSYEWDADGYITLKPWAWKTVVNQSETISWPFSIKGTFGRSGTWVPRPDEDIDRSAASKQEGEIRKHEILYEEYDPLEVSFNKTDFTADETLEVTVKIAGVKGAYLQVGHQFPVSMSPISSDTIKVSSGLSHLAFPSSSEWYNKVYGTVFFKSDGKTYFANFEQYISVRKPEVGYFEESTLFNGYGTYKAKVVESNPIKAVKWKIRKPGGKWEEVKHDKVNGGNSSSLSYSLDSTSPSGRYGVRAEVHFETNGTNYQSSFYVY